MLDSNQRPPPCKGGATLCRRSPEFAKSLQIYTFSKQRFSQGFRIFVWVAAPLLHTEPAWQDSNLRPSLLFVVRGSIRLSYKHVSLYMVRIR